jgi:hypothetical protein
LEEEEEEEEAVGGDFGNALGSAVMGGELGGG